MPTRLRDADAPSAAADDDRSLLHRFARARDEAAFAALVDRHGPLVYGVCRRALRDAQLAEDAFQAVFVVLARRARAVRVKASLASWLFGVARRVSLAAQRGERRRAVHELRAVARRPAAEPSADWDDLLRSLDDELARLPDALRAPILECFFRERTQDEAAKALGWSLSTLRRRLDRAKDVLRTRLTARGVALPAALFPGTLAATTALAGVSPTLVHAATNAGLAAANGGTLAGTIGTLANGGTAMSAITKAVLATAAVGVAAAVAAGASYGLGLWPVKQGVAAPPVVAPVEPPKPSPPAPVEPPKPAPPVVPPTPSAAPAALKGEWATIRGKVVWPANRKFVPVAVPVNTDKEHCLSNGPLVQEDIQVNPKNGGVKFVVVWLRPDTDDRKTPFPQDRVHPALKTAESRNHVVDQPCCQFVPRVVAARTGDTIEFKNSATVNHNINFKSDARPFNYNMVPSTSKKTGPLEAQTTPIPFSCDVHPWMAGRVRVFDHPYFAVTDADGNFEITDAPPGKWRLVYWHENGYHKGRDGALGFPLEARPGVTTALPTVELELPR